MNATERKIMRDLLHLVLDQREEDHTIRTYKDQDEHMIVERAKILLGMVASNPCDVCGILVREDEYLGYDQPNGQSEYLCEDCFGEKYEGISQEDYFSDDEGGE